MEEFLKTLGSIALVFFMLIKLFKKEKKADTNVNKQRDDKAKEVANKEEVIFEKQTIENDLPLEDKPEIEQVKRVKHPKIKKAMVEMKSEKREITNTNKRRKRNNNFIIDAKRDAKKALILGEILQKKY